MYVIGICSPLDGLQGPVAGARVVGHVLNGAALHRAQAGVEEEGKRGDGLTASTLTSGSNSFELKKGINTYSS